MAAPVTLSIDVHGIEPLVKNIGGMRRRLRNPAPAYRVTANLLEKHVAAVFQSQGARLGLGWKALAPSTVKARKRRWGYYRQVPRFRAGPTRPILTWSGRLRWSFRRGKPGHLRQVSASGLTWGSSVPYGGYHDSAGPRRGSLPRRAILDFQNEFQEREILVRPFQLYLQGVPPGAIQATVGARIGVGP